MLVDDLINHIKIDTGRLSGRYAQKFINVKRVEMKRWFADSVLIMDNKEPIYGHRLLILSGAQGCGKTRFLQFIGACRQRVDPKQPGILKQSEIIDIDDQPETIDHQVALKLSDLMKQSKNSFCGAVNDITIDILTLFDCAFIPIADIDWNYQKIDISKMYREINELSL